VNPLSTDWSCPAGCSQHVAADVQVHCCISHHWLAMTYYQTYDRHAWSVLVGMGMFVGQAA